MTDSWTLGNPAAPEDLAGVTGPPREMSPLEPVVERIEALSALDTPGRTLGRLLRGALPAGAVKDAVSGTWLGHPVHPALTDVVIGSWLSATILDLLGGEAAADAPQLLIAVGIAAYGPTALAGASDWADSEVGDDRVRRAGLVHAAGNAAALSLYVASLVARRRGSRATGVALGGLGATVLMGGGYLGGHLSLRRGVGSDQTVFDPGPTDWHPAADEGQLREGTPTRVVVDETPILLLRDGDRTYAIHDRCSHRGCSLSEGAVSGSEIECACHGSRFDLRNGAIVRGPATSPQPAFQVRARDGRIEVRRLSPSTP